MPKEKRIAIIGSGIAGLSTAFHLHKEFDITVYEKSDTLGGHTDTHDLMIAGEHYSIDSGFIVFCPEFYPHFSSMLSSLKVESKPTDMSFSMWNKGSGVIYNATSINTLFCQRKNLLNPNFYRMILDIVRFYRQAPAVLQQTDQTTSVRSYLDQQGYSIAFMRDHLFPMISALWSATTERVEQFPIRHLVEFMQKHGMMKLFNRPQWRVVNKGSQSYVAALQQQLECQWRTSTPVLKVQRNEHGVTVFDQQSSQQYDQVVFATHADQALALLDTPSPDEQAILSSIPFERNEVVVHSDESILNKNRLSWASWNTEVPADMSEQDCCTATYWMNLLQGLDMPEDVFVSLNSQHQIDPAKILKTRIYHHPIFTADSVAAQKQQSLINGQQNTFYVGAYWGWGFHEDGARSGYEAAQLIRKMA